MWLYLRNTPIVVSMTTTPIRLNTLHKTLPTILRQSFAPKAIYISIPYIHKRTGQPYIIPAWLKDEKRITILRSHDYGPATKLLGLLEQMNLPKNTIIITLDDDVFYPRNLLLHLAYAAKRNPAVAVGISGADLDYNAQGEINTDSHMGLMQYDSGRDVKILQGYAGVAYRADFFARDIFDLQYAARECIDADDLYFAFYLAKRLHARHMLNSPYINVGNIAWDTPIGCGRDALHLQPQKPALKHKACLSYLRAHFPEVAF